MPKWGRLMRARGHKHTCTHNDTKTKVPMHLRLSLTERIDSVGHLKGEYINEDLGFWLDFMNSESTECDHLS